MERRPGGLPGKDFNLQTKLLKQHFQLLLRPFIGIFQNSRIPRRAPNVIHGNLPGGLFEISIARSASVRALPGPPSPACFMAPVTVPGHHLLAKGV